MEYLEYLYKTRCGGLWSSSTELGRQPLSSKQAGQEWVLDPGPASQPQGFKALSGSLLA